MYRGSVLSQGDCCLACKAPDRSGSRYGSDPYLKLVPFQKPTRLDTQNHVDRQIALLSHSDASALAVHCNWACTDRKGLDDIAPEMLGTDVARRPVCTAMNRLSLVLVHGPQTQVLGLLPYEGIAVHAQPPKEPSLSAVAVQSELLADSAQTRIARFPGTGLYLIRVEVGTVGVQMLQECLIPGFSNLAGDMARSRWKMVSCLVLTVQDCMGSLEDEVALLILVSFAK